MKGVTPGKTIRLVWKDASAPGTPVQVKFRPAPGKTTVMVTRIDLDKHVEVQTVVLERRPEVLIAVGLVKDSFMVYGILDGQLVEYEPPD